MKLNKEQNQVKTHSGGPLVVASVPGSGKTRCVVERIKHLIDSGIDRKEILAVTFTNKAAHEMRARLEKEGYQIGLMTISTFHSLCTQILRQCGSVLGFTKNFNIYDENDQRAQMKQVLKELGYLPNKAEIEEAETLGKLCISLDPDKMVHIAETIKNGLLDQQSIENNYSAEQINAYNLYQKRLKLNNAMDFTDLLYCVNNLFVQYPQLAKHFSAKWKHILVDEMQDTNTAQYAILEHLMTTHKNVVLIGDSDQCFTPDTLVNTINGQKRIDEIVINDYVSAVYGENDVREMKVTNILKRNYTGKLIKIELDNGQIIKCTPNHWIPSEIRTNEPYVVYLMYKQEVGYRIGFCKSDRSGVTDNGWINRLCSEHGDAIWIIDVADSQSKAQMLEQYYAIKYGLPTVCFHTIGRKTSYNDDDIKWLFTSINTFDNAEKLAKIKYIDLQHPVHSPKMSSCRKGRYNLNITMCADKGLHRYSINSNNKNDIEKLGKTRKSKLRNWRIEKFTKDSDIINKFIDKAKSILKHIRICTKLKADSDGPLEFNPASHLLAGSIIYYYENNSIVRRTIKDISYENYEGYVYDLNIERVHNYIVNGMVVHNSIYSWRGAKPSNINKFIDKYNPTLIKLETNYRSTPEILERAYKIISNNQNRIDVHLHTNNTPTNGVHYLSVSDNKNEAELIVRLIKKQMSESGFKYSDFAILYRTNAISHEFESACRHHNIPYKVYGGFGFYDRREIKTCLSYMKLLANPKDVLSWNSCINEPRRGVGEACQIKLIKESFKSSKAILDLCFDPPTTGANKATAPQIVELKKFAKLFENVDWANPHKHVRDIIEKSGLIESLQETDKSKNETRAENVQELLNSFEYWVLKNPNSDLSQYLQEIQLASDVDESNDEDHVKLMTIHAAKGLEFPVVFIVAMEEGILPHKMSLSESGPDEERRLAYVAITRAMKYLYLTRAEYRFVRGEMKKTIPSRFLYEAEFIEANDDENQDDYTEFSEDY